MSWNKWKKHMPRINLSDRELERGYVIRPKHFRAIYPIGVKRNADTKDLYSRGMCVVITKIVPNYNKTIKVFFKKVIDKNEVHVCEG